MTAPRLIPVLLLCLWAPLLQGQHKVAITLDDLPCTSCGNASKVTEVNRKILDALTSFQLPAVGFVN